MTTVRMILPTLVFGALLLALPETGFADKGGKPNRNSVAATAACIEPDGSVHVYSCKALSNVVIWCGGTYIKFDNIGNGEEVYGEVLGSGDAEGPITFVAIKSGSQKHKKHNDGYTPPEGLPDNTPSGSGLFVGDIPGCPLPAESIPVPGDCDAELTDPEDPEDPPDTRG